MLIEQNKLRGGDVTVPPLHNKEQKRKNHTALDKTKVVYQIYPKSYKDTTGNGIGYFRGIIEKIPYLADLGVDMVWLNPFYPSLQRDNGYDISHYTAVNPVFGDMADFEEMVRVGKEHKIDFMLDMVLNHC